MLLKSGNVALYFGRILVLMSGRIFVLLSGEILLLRSDRILVLRCRGILTAPTVLGEYSNGLNILPKLS